MNETENKLLPVNSDCFEGGVSVDMFLCEFDFRYCVGADLTRRKLTNGTLAIMGVIEGSERLISATKNLGCLP